MLIVDTILYAILAWYIEAVHPGSYGLPRPWYFPFQASYWFGHNTKACPKFSRSYMMVNDEDAPHGPPGTLAYEKDPMNLPLGVVIDGLVKVIQYLLPTGSSGLLLSLSTIMQEMIINLQ
jgi:hypothetical protein